MNEKLPHITDSALYFLFEFTCSWCRERTTKEKEIYETDAKFVGEEQLKKYDGKIIPLTMEEVPHSVLALVKTKDELKLNFCSPACVELFKKSTSIVS